ncbi:uncharacterized protein [Rutidosis leptorrhynchoides]|uniref:uncharacterized protein n=1 Tax=Rutidosis leptorrhynchoides TaxID=125765 RepID=UPI003A99AA87
MSHCFPPSANNVSTQKNNLIPKKVGVFVWRAKRKRLPVLVELDKRGVDLNSVRCPLCDDTLESVEHTLFSCVHAKVVWEKVYNWWGNLTSLGGFDDAFDGKFNTQASILGAKIWQAVQWTTGYLIWKNRNQKVFKNSSWSPPMALNEIQVKSYDWVAKRCKSKKIEWHDWLNNPISVILNRNQRHEILTSYWSAYDNDMAQMELNEQRCISC